MPTYIYKVKDSAGNTRTGTLEASDERHAAAMIREAGGLPMDIRPAGGAVPAAQADRPAVMRHLVDPLWTGVNIRGLVYFFRQIAVLLNAGLSLSEALRSVGSRCRGRLRKIAMEAALNVQNGARLSDTMARYPGVFSPLCLSLVRAGEASGLLAPMVERIASNLEYEISIRNKIAKIMLYPVIVLVLAVALLMFLGWLPAWCIRSVPWIIGGVIALRLVMQFESARFVWDSIKVLPPVLGTMAHKIAMTRFCRAISDLYAAGVPIAAALDASADASANVAIGRGIKRAIPAVRGGEGLTSALMRTRVVMPIVLDMLATGEKTGSYDMVLTKVAEYMEEEVDATINKAGTLLFVLMMLIAAVVVLMIAANFYGGYFENVFRSAGS